MVRVGLKLWSVNREHVAAARALYAEGVFDYLELFVVPGSIDRLSDWEGLKVPYALHAPHSYTQFNPSFADNERVNREILKDVALYADALDPSYVVFHPGIDGRIEETIRQFGVFKKEFPAVFSRALVENKPALGQKGESCLGASPAEIEQLMKALGMGFCLDFGHAVCYAVWAGLSLKAVLTAFTALNPQAYHVCDGDKTSVTDRHLHLGQGNFDLKMFAAWLNKDARVAIESQHDYPDRLDDFKEDAAYLKRLTA